MSCKRVPHLFSSTGRLIRWINQTFTMQSMRLLLFSLFIISSSASKKDTDIINDLPGLTYQLNFKQYSGYLEASTGNHMHYWLVESQSKPATDPLVLWLNGGPGCSSLGGLFNFIGPFHPNPDGTTLFENIYSWNKEANILFLEAPRDVGFSYQNKTVLNDTVFNDDKTAWDNFLALKDFFASYPEYSSRDFYVMGESYGGVYVPTLTRLLIQQIQAGNLTANLVGMAVGNGELSEYQQINSVIVLLYTHGIYSKDEFDALSSCCPNNSLIYCNFAQYIKLLDDGTAVAVDNSSCAKLVERLGSDSAWGTGNTETNLYQDCYEGSGIPPLTEQSESVFAQSRAPDGFIDQYSRINWWSTDSSWTFPCYMGGATEKYLNQDNVRTALHIQASVPPYWFNCNGDIYQNYIQQNHDTSQIFYDMIATGYNLRMLIYNGDVDTVCNFLGDEWFVEALVAKYNMTSTFHHQPWRFTSQTNAGYRKAFSYQNITIDLVTVKGAGHFVPTDRPGPALQMITNFIKNTSNYSLPTGYPTQRIPLLPQYQPAPPSTCATPSPGGASNAAFSAITILLCVLLLVVPLPS